MCLGVCALTMMVMICVSLLFATVVRVCYTPMMRLTNEYFVFRFETLRFVRFT